jgi:hypothetical protein
LRAQNRFSFKKYIAGLLARIAAIKNRRAESEENDDGGSCGIPGTAAFAPRSDYS